MTGFKYRLDDKEKKIKKIIVMDLYVFACLRACVGVFIGVRVSGVLYVFMREGYLMRDRDSVFKV